MESGKPKNETETETETKTQSDSSTETVDKKTNYPKPVLAQDNCQIVNQDAETLLYLLPVCSSDFYFFRFFFVISWGRHFFFGAANSDAPYKVVRVGSGRHH